MQRSVRPFAQCNFLPACMYTTALGWVPVGEISLFMFASSVHRALPGGLLRDCRANKKKNCLSGERNFYPIKATYGKKTTESKLRLTIDKLVK